MAYPLAEADESGESSIRDLAAGADAGGNRKGGLGGFFRRIKVPLLCLAPSLVVLSLASVVVPVATILITTSQSSTHTLSTGYLGNMMAKTVEQISATLSPLRTFAEMATQTFAVEKAMALQMESDSMTPDFIATMVQWRRNTNLDIISCFKSRWRPGYGLGDSINLTTVQVRGSFAFGRNGTELFGQYSSSEVPEVYAVFPPDTPKGAITGSQPGNYTTVHLPQVLWAQVPKELLLPGNQQRTGVFFSRDLPPPPQAYYSVTMGRIVNSTLNVAPNQGYGCTASLNVDAQWNQLLKNARPTNDTVIIVLENKSTLGVVASTLQGGVVVAAGYGYNSTADPIFTYTIQKDVIARYTNWTNIPKTKLVVYESQLDTGSDWIVMISGIKLTQYDTDVLILVSATPRSVIFGNIDAAQKRSMGIAIGLSLGVSVLIAALFGLVTAPLWKLAIAVGELAQHNFGALQDGKLLGKESFILELSRVQVAFATMVKAL
ncbi:hypothetical protein HDU90_005137 [Geranomyces variabilis]|nr:hypothetical protein HDU90_005137 [Geranomyces variabilis]